MHRAFAKGIGFTWRRTLSRDHDVTDDLARGYKSERMPSWFKEKMPRFAMLSQMTTALSKFARCGHESFDAPPLSLFKEEEAKMCLESAREVLEACERLSHG